MIVSWLIVVVGGSAALVLQWGVKHLVWAIALIFLSFAATVLNGSYREAKRIDHDHEAEIRELARNHGKELEAAQNATRLALSAQSDRLRLQVEPNSAEIETWLDLQAQTDAWESQQRSRYLAARSKAMPDLPGDISSLARSVMYTAAMLDTRSPEEYASEVADYLKDLHSSLQSRTLWLLSRHEASMLSLRLVNPGDNFYAQVRFSASIAPAAGRPLNSDELFMVDFPGEPKLPKPPAPRGTATVDRLSSIIEGYDPYRGAYMGSHAPERQWKAETVDGIVRITWLPRDLHAHNTVELPAVPIMVTTSPGSQLVLAWEATATNTMGKLSGQVALKVSASTLAGKVLRR